LVGINQEGQLTEGVAHYQVEHFNLGLDLVNILGCLSSGLFVINESFKVPNVSLKFILHDLCFILVRFQFLLFIVIVTFVVVGVILCPVEETDPAKIVLARSTFHMIASLILLNRFVTIGAGFCIG
jgi:hypothetical protein